MDTQKRHWGQAIPYKNYAAAPLS